MKPWPDMTLAERRAYYQQRNDDAFWNTLEAQGKSRLAAPRQVLNAHGVPVGVTRRRKIKVAK